MQMANVEPLIRAWDEAIWEYGLVFEGLADEDVWKRPHPRLLSIGELTAHVAYYEPRALTGPALIPEWEDQIKSVLIDPAFKYYSLNVQNPVVLNVGAEETISELKRVHEESKAFVNRIERDTEDPIEGAEKMTWGFYLRYRIFHAAYHAGQAYSVRHLFGHETTDN